MPNHTKRFLLDLITHPCHNFSDGLCTFLLQNGALWDTCLLYCGICETGARVCDGVRVGSHVTVWHTAIMGIIRQCRSVFLLPFRQHFLDSQKMQMPSLKSVGQMVVEIFYKQTEMDNHTEFSYRLTCCISLLWFGNIYQKHIYIFSWCPMRSWLDVTSHHEVLVGGDNTISGLLPWFLEPIQRCLRCPRGGSTGAACRGKRAGDIWRRECREARAWIVQWTSQWFPWQPYART